MKTSLISAAVFVAVLGGVLPGQAQDPFIGLGGGVPETPIDKFVFPKLAQIGVHPAMCSDAVFIRRVFLDMLGTVPTAKEAREFIQSTDRNKRRVLIDRVLERDEYADYWAMKWSDILRVKAEFPVNLWPNAAQSYHRWIRASMAENKPYDKFVREMLTSSGSNFRVGPVNFYRAVQNKTPEGIAISAALVFMGSRAEFWPKHYLPGMKSFFSQIGFKATREWKEEVVFWDPTKVTNNVPQMATFPDGTQIQLPADRDPREVFADWLIKPENPWFTLNIVNRMWSWLLGRGVIHEPDDIRSNNPPSNPPLLTYLRNELVTSRYDMKHVFKLILNSRTYQISSVVRYSNPQIEANFGAYPLRRLDAEVLIDVINKITGTSDLYTSAIPEPFTFIPDNKPAVALPDGSISSSFLELFGRSPRATGMENERVYKPLPSQRLHLLNSSHIQRKIEEGPKMKALFEGKRKSREIVDDLYLTILSRFPSGDEARLAEAHANSKVVKGQEGWIDVAWALVNSIEFLYRH
ncbi:MAG: DUF1553 domain-containing protein [Verrucomicrobia bacterium]|nr:DUF1553 domain-containing protein [Verrucomicrobiota bacterium]